MCVTVLVEIKPCWDVKGILVCRVLSAHLNPFISADGKFGSKLITKKVPVRLRTPISRTTDRQLTANKENASFISYNAQKALKNDLYSFG
jgi:hypothetical protein